MQKEYSIQQGQSIWDVANLVNGGLDNVFTLITLNKSVFANINDDLDSLSPISIVYDTDYDVKSPLELGLSAPTAKPNIVVQGYQNMNLFDACIMGFGDLNNIVKMIQNNDLYSLNDHDITGRVINFARTENANPALQKAIEKKNYVLSSYQFIAGERVTTWFEERVTTDLEIRLIN